MAWPTTIPTTTNLDSTTDNVALGLAEIKTAIDQLIIVIQNRNQANGVAGLNAYGLLDANRVPVVPLERGGTGETTASAARDALGLGTAATRDRDQPSGVAGLNTRGEVKQLYDGAAAADAGSVLYANGTWAAPIPAGSGWITQGMLKVSTGTVSGGSTSGSGTTLPGGRWGFYPQVRDGQNLDRVRIWDGTSLTDWKTSISFVVTSGGSDYGRARQTYIQASPPYAIESMNVPLFIFFGARDGQIVDSYVAEEPPWALNGQTEIHPWSPEYGMQYFSMDVLRDPVRRATFIEKARRGEPLMSEPVSDDPQKIKQWDMPAIPHPFGPDTKAVLVDPEGDEIKELSELHRRGVDLMDCVREDILRIDNTALKRPHPPGVDVVRARWK